MKGRLATLEYPIKNEFLEMRENFKADKDKNKIFLGIGAYTDDNGDPWVLPVVRKVELQIAADSTMDHEYLWFLGDDTFSLDAMKLLLGQDNPAIAAGKAVAIQSLSGTGALRIGAQFLNEHLKYRTCYLSSPTWENHRGVFEQAGFSDMRTYRYWEPVKRTVDMEGLLEDLRQAPENAMVILQSSGHNPTGCDPTREQWEQIADVIQERKLFPFFDSAYQGFASGSLEEDSWAVRYFIERGFDMFCAQSFSKNMGLYDERTGNLTAVWSSRGEAELYKSHMHCLIRHMYLCPPKHGTRIVKAILHDPELYKQWIECIQTMANRIKDMRKCLKERLEKLKTPGNWDHITTQIGMFSFTGLTCEQVDHMSKVHHIYMMRNGRANVCGLTHKNLDYVAQAIHEAVTHCPDVALGKKTTNCSHS